MTEKIFFFLITFFFGLCSVLGYGFIFKKLFLKKFNSENFLDYNGIYGLGFLSFIALVTSIFIPHNFTHNIVIHSFGFFSFIFSLKNNKKYFRNILLITICFFSLLLIFKTNEDFPYYHLPFTKYLVENKIIFGMGNIAHGYNYISSLFFLNSTFYLPYIEFQSYHFSTLYYLIFFNYFLLTQIFYRKNNLIINYLYLFAFTFFNISFNRIAEYGTDKIGQLIIIIIIIKLIDILCSNKHKINLEKLFFLIPLLGLCLSLKTYFLPYLLLALPVIFSNREMVKNLFYLIKSKPFVFFICFIFVVYFHHFVSTGCIVSPIPLTCFNNEFLWARNIDEVIGLSNWLEQWSKAGAGPNFRVENPELYIKYLNWVPNWIEKYFFVKVLDQIGILISSYILILFLFKNLKINKKNFEYNKKNLISIYIIIIILFLIWFNKHPALRYGGYPVFFLIFSIPIAYFFSKLKDKNYFYFRAKYFVLFICVVINIKNFIRIHNEFFKEEEKKINYFPFYLIEETPYVKKKFYEDFTIYSTTKRFCWTIPSPCGNFDNIYVQKKNTYFFINKTKE